MIATLTSHNIPPLQVHHHQVLVLVVHVGEKQNRKSVANRQQLKNEVVLKKEEKKELSALVGGWSKIYSKIQASLRSAIFSPILRPNIFQGVIAMLYTFLIF